MNQDKPQFVRQTQEERMKAGVLEDHANMLKNAAAIKAAGPKPHSNQSVQVGYSKERM
jgi:hypothetical protein